MSAHGHGSHGGGTPTEWVSQHLGGLILPMGKKFEGFLDKIMFLLVNGFFARAATLYLVIFTPILLFQFLRTYIGV
jgi:hypothetical protein